jgi:5-methyltetrahydrofolate--homocysteine methyltransferase
VTGLLEKLHRGERLVGDGAMGTMLMARGLEPGGCPERWNLDRPEVLEEIARLYCEAGAELVETNTFGGSPLKLAMYGLDTQTEEINAAAVAAVRRAVGDRAFVSGSCGPTGRMLLPYGDLTPEIMAAAFERQTGALIEAGVDLICVETMTDLAEARLAVEAARRQSSTIPICATMTFDPTPNGFFTVMGTSIEQAVIGLSEAGADIIGSNCGNGIDNMVSIAEAFRRFTNLPLIIQPNAGLPEIVEGTLRYGETPEFMAERTRKLLDLGVNIVGGCCGTTPEHIAAIRRVVDTCRAAS